MALAGNAVFVSSYDCFLDSDKVDVSIVYEKGVYLSGKKANIRERIETLYLIM